MAFKALEDAIQTIKKRLGAVESRQKDTGWVTSGLTITPATNWTVLSYRLRRVGNRVLGKVVVRYDNATTITADSSGNITDITSVVTMPTDWRNLSGATWHVPFVQTGVKTWWGRSNNSSGAIDLTHASFNAQTITQNTQLDIQLDYLTD